MGQVVGVAVAVLQGPPHAVGEHPFQLLAAQLQVFPAGTDAGRDVAEQGFGQFVGALLDVFAAQS